MESDKTWVKGHDGSKEQRRGTTRVLCGSPARADDLNLDIHIKSLFGNPAQDNVRLEFSAYLTIVRDTTSGTNMTSY
jgi:hypothetical protein